MSLNNVARFIVPLLVCLAGVAAARDEKDAEFRDAVRKFESATEWRVWVSGYFSSGWSDATWLNEAAASPDKVKDIISKNTHGAVFCKKNIILSSSVGYGDGLRVDDTGKLRFFSKGFTSVAAPLERAIDFKEKRIFGMDRRYSKGIAPNDEMSDADFAKLLREELYWIQDRVSKKWRLAKGSVLRVSAKTYDDVAIFSDGAAPVMNVGRWSYIDESENIVSREFDEAHRFYEGVACVKSGKYWQILNSKFEPIADSLDEAWDCRDARILAKRSGKWGMLDNKGKTILSFMYHSLSPPQNGLMVAELDENTTALVNESGTRLFEAKSPIKLFLYHPFLIVEAGDKQQSVRISSLKSENGTKP